MVYFAHSSWNTEASFSMYIHLYTCIVQQLENRNITFHSWYDSRNMSSKNYPKMKILRFFKYFCKATGEDEIDLSAYFLKPNVIK